LLRSYDFNAITRCSPFRSCGPSVTSPLHLLPAAGSAPYASASKNRRISRERAPWASFRLSRHHTGSEFRAECGRINRGDLKRHWPHHVALPANKARGVMNSQIVWSFAETLSAAPRPYFLCRDDGDYVVFCFTKPEDAQAFAERFGGEGLPGAVRR